MDFIRLVTWPGVERLSRKRYKGLKIIYRFLNIDTRIINQVLGKIVKVFFYEYSIIFINFSFFFSLFFFFSSLCDDISCCKFTSFFDGFLLFDY